MDRSPYVLRASAEFHDGDCLLDEIRRLQRIESDPEVKVLVFTEFVPTQEMLAEFLSERGFVVTRLNGSMGMEERIQAQREFAAAAQHPFAKACPSIPLLCRRGPAVRLRR